MRNHLHYILDFDGVIFDTQRLKRYIREAHLQESERDEHTLDTLQNINPSLHFQTMVYTDADSFLHTHGEHCTIVSTSQSIHKDNNTDIEKQHAYQQQKIARSGVSGAVNAVHIVDGAKTDILRQIYAEQKLYGNEILFVDDSETFLAQAIAVGLESVLMSRNASASHSKDGICLYPIVHSFDELVTYVEQRTIT